MLEVVLPFISFMHDFFFKGHNMLAFMLDPRYKNMHLVITYLGCEATTTLVTIMMNNCCYLYCWRLTKVYYQIQRIVWMNLPHLWILGIYSNILTQSQIPTRTLYVKSLVHSVGILLMHKLVHVL